MKAPATVRMIFFIWVVETIGLSNFDIRALRSDSVYVFLGPRGCGLTDTIYIPGHGCLVYYQRIGLSHFQYLLCLFPRGEKIMCRGRCYSVMYV